MTIGWGYGATARAIVTAAAIGPEATGTGSGMSTGKKQEQAVWHHGIKKQEQAVWHHGIKKQEQAVWHHGIHHWEQNPNRLSLANRVVLGAGVGLHI